jgi:hypothetical protein
MSVSDLRLDTMKITAKKLPEPSRWKRRGRVERQESRCRRRGFANVWLTGMRRSEKERDERREKGTGTAGRSLGGKESGRAKRRHKTRDDDEDPGQAEESVAGGEREARERLEGPRSKIVYNEEAAGRPGTGSSHYRRSSSATRLSVLVARHASVERPARCTCSCAAHRSSVTAAPYTRTLSVLLRASSPPFLFEPASGLFRSFCSIRPIFLALLSPSNLLFSFLLGQASVFRVSLLLLLLLLRLLLLPLLLLLLLLLERLSKLILSSLFSFLPFSYDRFTTRAVSSVLILATRARSSLFCTPADRTHTSVAHYPI